MAWNKPQRRLLRSFITTCCIVLAVGVYTYGALQQLAVVNLDMHNTDQSAYMNYGRKLREFGAEHVGNRNRMPVYPLLLATIYKPGMSYDAYFLRGKVLNLILSLLILSGFLWIFRKTLSRFLSINLLLTIAFSVFMYKASFVQAELLFYAVNFVFFLLMWRMLAHDRPPLSLAIATGVVAGVAHLTKASILPGLLLFLSFGALKWGLYLAQHRAKARAGRRALARAASPLLGLLLVGAAFLVTVSPYIITSKRVFGHYFYNVNSTFYMWYESWEEARDGTKAHGDRVGWPDMPLEEIPSMRKYLREHTLGEILWRFISGAQQTWESVRGSYGYHLYIFAYGGFLSLAALRYRARAWRRIKAAPFEHLFLVAYFAAYGLLYAWYAWITWGNRFILAQFVPMIYVLGRGLEYLLRPATVTLRRDQPHTMPALLAMNLVMVGFTVSHIAAVLLPNIDAIFGGS
jgi:hypothetical protein